MVVSVQSALEMRELGASLTETLTGGTVMFLHGSVGAGKTTLVQGMLQALGVHEAITSPTFSLVEVYECNLMQRTGQVCLSKIWHFDLYRISDPEELEMIGARESFNGTDVVLIEWPENGAGFLPSADVDVIIEIVATRDDEKESNKTQNCDLRSGLSAVHRTKSAAAGALPRQVSVHNNG